MNSILFYATEIDEISNENIYLCQQRLFDRYNSISHQEDKEAFVLGLIAKIKMQKQQLTLVKEFRK